MANKIKVIFFESVPGLYYIKDCKIDLNKILSKLDEREWKKLSSSSNSRKVQHYGYLYDYKSRRIDVKCEDIPDFLIPLQNKLEHICDQLGLFEKDKDDNYEFNQCIVNNYESGQGISSHIDVKKYGKIIGCYTANSGATMTFRKGNYTKHIYVKPNSLYIMSGDSRFKFTHEMATRNSDVVNDEIIKRDRRISITFRYVDC